MQPVNLVYQEGRFAPASGADHEILDREYGNGELLTTELKPVQSNGQRQFWAMINIAYKSEKQFANLWDNSEAFADAVKISVKHRQAGQTLGGMPYFIGLSLAQVKDWEFFNMAVKGCLINKLGVPEELLTLPDPDKPADRPSQETDADTFPGDTPSRQADGGGQADTEVKGKAPPAARKRKPKDPAPVAICRECAEKMLAFAEDIATFGDNTVGHLKTLATVSADWAETIPEHAGFVEAVTETCERIISSPRSDHAKRAKLHDLALSQVPTEDAKP